MNRARNLNIFSALASLSNSDEVESALKDLLTPKEIALMSERLHVAFLLEKGLPYREVAEQTRTSTATVTRVARFLKTGYGGYKLLLRDTVNHL